LAANSRRNARTLSSKICLDTAQDFRQLRKFRACQARQEPAAPLLANLKEIETKHGSVVNYLLNYRLQWGKPDRLSLLRSTLDVSAESSNTCGRISNASQASEDSVAEDSDADALLPTQEGLLYFKADTPPELISIIMCDWPYSVPLEIEHALIWTRLPILPPSLPSADDCPLSARLHQYGLWGFTGLSSPPPSPSTLPACLPALSEWGVTLEDLTIAPPMTEEEERGVRLYSTEVEKFIKRRWVEPEWETAWFVHPPRLQSVPGLAHIHVFAKHKTPEDSSCDNE
ncbi:hypothetical protein A0H81_08947, partial [Grifola frondosa]